MRFRRYTVKPKSQILGQLPFERITPGPVFDTVGVDYAGPFLIKYGYTRKPTIVKAYVCVFVSLTVKAVHLELYIVSGSHVRSLHSMLEEVYRSSRFAITHME